MGEKKLCTADLGALHLAADSLTRIVAEERIEDADLIGLELSLAEIVSQVGNADMGPDLKAALLRALARLQDAIRNYRYIGAEAIQNAAAQAIGEMVFLRGEVVKSKEAEWVAQYFITLERILAITQAAVLGHQATKLTIGFAQMFLK